MADDTAVPIDQDIVSSHERSFLQYTVTNTETYNWTMHRVRDAGLCHIPPP